MPKTVYGQRQVPQVLLDRHVEVRDKIRALLYWRKLSPPHQKELSKQYSVLQAEMIKLSKELEMLATKDYEELDQNYFLSTDFDIIIVKTFSLGGG